MNDQKRNISQEAGADGVIEGRNAVIEALRAGTAVDKIYLQKGETDKTLGHIASTARAAGVVVVEADRRKLDAMSATHAHQGVIAVAAVREYAGVDDILNAAREKGEPPLIVVCDELSDPHNLGAVLRTVEGFGAHGVIIARHGACPVNETVVQVAAGAAEYVPVARVANIAAALDSLKQQGLWVCGTHQEGAGSLWQAELKGPLAIVLGSEGRGLPPLVARKCDFMVQIPMQGRINSFNVSVSAGIMLAEAVRQRQSGQK